MRVDVVLFAGLREALQVSRVSVQLEAGATAGDLQRTLTGQNPTLESLIASCRLAQGVEFIDANTVLDDGVEVVLIPPVSGGKAIDEVLLTTEPLVAEPLKTEAYAATAGAVVVFEGTVRSPSSGKDVEYLEYEAYAEMAVSQMRRIVAEVREQWPAQGVYLHHRLGRVLVGEVSVIAVASAPHRGQAFEACRHLIEKLKADVPIWKKEVFADGSVWVGSPGDCA